MTDAERREKVVQGLELCLKGLSDLCPYKDSDAPGGRRDELMYGAMALLKAQEPITGETSDGYHTFNELYHHRAVLFSVIVSSYPERAWKAKKHHDGTMYDGMFIVGIETPSGQATYHYDINPYWDMFKCRELANAPEWDGHTPAQAIERIGGLAGLKVQEPRVLTEEELEDWLEPVYLEDIFYGGRWALIADFSANWFTFNVTEPGFLKQEEFHVSEYGRRWRCWSARPSEEQREAVKWE